MQSVQSCAAARPRAAAPRESARHGAPGRTLGAREHQRPRGRGAAAARRATRLAARGRNKALGQGVRALCAASTHTQPRTAPLPPPKSDVTPRCAPAAAQRAPERLLTSKLLASPQEGAPHKSARLRPHRRAGAACARCGAPRPALTHTSTCGGRHSSRPPHSGDATRGWLTRAPSCVFAVWRAVRPSRKRSRRARCAANGGGGVQQGASGKAELQSHSERMASSSLLGDIGARDAFEAETMSNFGENVLGNSDTEHEILIPNVRKLDRNSLMNTPCSAEGAAKAIVGDESEVLLKQLNLANLKVRAERSRALSDAVVAPVPAHCALGGAR